MCVAFPALSAIETGFDVFVVTDASGTFNPLTRDSARNRMSSAGVQLMTGSVWPVNYTATGVMTLKGWARCFPTIFLTIAT